LVPAEIIGDTIASDAEEPCTGGARGLQVGEMDEGTLEDERYQVLCDIYGAGTEAQVGQDTGIILLIQVVEGDFRTSGPDSQHCLL
jgi:hypothetical protein